MEIKMEVFTFLFLTLGPIKIIGPYMSIVQHATPKMAFQIALRATLFSCLAILIATLLGERILTQYGIPLPILTLSGGLILFLVALLSVIKQFDTNVEERGEIVNPKLSMAMHPLAFPTIVTPYGLAAVIVFLSVCEDIQCKLRVVAILVGIMVLNFVVMLISRRIFKPLSLILAVLGAVLGIVQVALGLSIIFRSVTALYQGS